MEEVSDLITQRLEVMDRGLIRSKYKAINALFPYAVRLGRSGKQRMIGMSLRAAIASGSKEVHMASRGTFHHEVVQHPEPPLP
jgi:hypothetical protein